MTRSLFRCLMLVAFAASACDADGGPAARVGDVDISHERVEGDIAAFRFLASLSGATCGASAEGENEDAACARLTLANEIQEELVKAYAVERDLSVAAADVDEAIAQIEQSLGGAQALDVQLAEAEFSRAGLLGLAERLLLFNVVRESIAEESVDEEALRASYEESIARFTTVEVAHILLETREEAEEVAARATPENFARLARERSIDPGSAESGGGLGSYSEEEYRQQFDPTFVEASLALRAGEISGVVETQFGFHVIELVRRDVAAFDDVRDQLEAQQGAEAYDEWLRDQYDSVDIEVNPRYGRLDVDTGQILPVTSTDDEAGTAGASGVSGPSGVTAP